MEKRESSFIVGGNVNWFSHYSEQDAVSLRKLKTEQLIPYDPTMPLLGIYPEKAIIWKDTCIPMFTAALFFFSFIFISWRLVTLQYSSGFCHTLT